MRRFCLLILLLVFVSCNITKRKYLPGYSIETNQRIEAIHQITPEKKLNAHSPTIAVGNTVLPLTEINLQPSLIPNKTIAIASKSNKIKKEFLTKGITQLVKAVSDSLQKKTENNKQVYEKAMTSFWLGICVVLLPIIMIPLGIYTIYPPGADDSSLAAYIIFGFIFWTIFSITGFVNGVRAIKFIKKNSDSYRGLGFAIAGVVMSSIVLAFYAAIFIAFIALLLRL